MVKTDYLTIGIYIWVIDPQYNYMAYCFQYFNAS
jgi:hypothetical protein